MLLGSHLSTAKGLHAPLVRAHEYRFSCVAMFVRNQVQWKRRPLRADEIDTFRRTRRELPIAPVVAHASYLVNLAGRYAVRRKSIAAMRHDLDRCDRLGVEYLVLHPGTRENAEQGIGLIADALNRIMAESRSSADAPNGPTTILLETTAGQGNCLGHRFEQIADMLDRLEQSERFGVCLDTCHIFAAGYDLRTAAAYQETMRQFDRTIGLGRLRAIHLNDAKRTLGSRVDRHEHIGRGRIGREGFRHVVTDPRLADVPMILETPKGQDERGRDWDTVNARLLRRLARSRPHKG